MKSANYAAMLVDLDGTLIGPDLKYSPRVLEAVAQLRREIPVSIATGRPPDEVVGFARQLGLTTPQICDGGATILDPASQRPLWRGVSLGPERSREILAALDHQRVAFFANYPGGSITSLAQFGDRDLARITALELAEPLADELVQRFAAADLEVVKVYLPATDRWGVNFASVGVDKGVAAVKLAELMSLDPRRLIGAGDSYNDLPLLKACGLKIAMGDAPPELKAIADYVAPPVAADGLAVAVIEFVLPRL